MKNASDSHISKTRLETIKMWNDRTREMSKFAPSAGMWHLQTGQCDDIDYLLGLINDKIEGSTS